MDEQLEIIASKIIKVINDNEHKSEERKKQLGAKIDYTYSKLSLSIDSNEDKCISILSELKNAQNELKNTQDEIKTVKAIISSNQQSLLDAMRKKLESTKDVLMERLSEIPRNKDLQEHNNSVLSALSQSFSEVDNKIKCIQNGENIIAQKLQTINNEQVAIRKSIQEVTNNLKEQDSVLSPLNDIERRLDSLCKSLISLEKDVLSKERSLNEMVGKHVQIFESTQELQNTSEEIFDLMKLMLMDSLVKQTTSSRL